MDDFGPYYFPAATWIAIIVIVAVGAILFFIAKWFLERADRNNKIAHLKIDGSSKKLKLFLLEREGSCHGDVTRFVILAKDDKVARHIAEQEGRDYRNLNIWLEGASCKAIDMTVPQIVLRDILEV